MKRIILATILLTATANIAVADNNRQAGEWIARAGIGAVLPDGDGLTVPTVGTIKADDAYSLTLTGVYMVTESVGIELLASYFWDHDIKLDGTKIGKTKQLPPTLSVQWHTPSIGALQPYLGLGLNYTIFFKSKSSLGGLSLDNSLGLATQAGFDYDINDQWLVNLDLRWINIETDAKLNGAKLGTVEVDPFVVSVNVGYKF